MNISVESPKVKFEEHLSQPENNRILFSGKFGTGKSHFLKEFFKVDDANSKYNVFWISPINYVVGANQDIFEWIKVDVAKELLFNYLKKTTDQIDSKDFLVQSYIYQNTGSIFNALLTSVANELTKDVTGIDFLATFKKQIEEYKKFEKKAIKEGVSDFVKLDEFITKATSFSGSIFEDDITTRIIRANIELLTYNSQKESILIIDDLDRLDPEHIFRILNILSCHNNHFDSNKFGFDKVILVCDIHNIEVIYKHKYGDADFNGYIEKFYTYEPFYYSLKQAILDFCRTDINIDLFDTSHMNVLSLLLDIFFKQNLLKIRNLKKIMCDFKFSHINATKMNFGINAIPQHYPTFIKSQNVQVSLGEFKLFRILQLLIIASGGVDKFTTNINYLKNVNDKIDVEAHDDMFKVLGIISAISRGYIRGNQNVFFRFSQEYTNNRMDSPIIQCLNNSPILYVKWDFEKPYKSGEYFEGVRIMKNSNNNEGITTSMLVSEISHILNYAVYNKIFTNVLD